jgi:hypothetical protein
MQKVQTDEFKILLFGNTYISQDVGNWLCLVKRLRWATPGPSWPSCLLFSCVKSHHIHVTCVTNHILVLLCCWPCKVIMQIIKLDLHGHMTESMLPRYFTIMCIFSLEYLPKQILCQPVPYNAYFWLPHNLKLLKTFERKEKILVQQFSPITTLFTSQLFLFT